MPNHGYYTILKDDNNPVSSFNSKIIIGPLRPANELKIVVWTTKYDYPTGRFDKAYRITYPDGFNNIEFYIKVNGFTAWTKENPNAVFFICFFFILSTIFIILSYIDSYTRRYSPDRRAKKEEKKTT